MAKSSLLLSLPSMKPIGDWELGMGILSPSPQSSVLSPQSLN